MHKTGYLFILLYVIFSAVKISALTQVIIFSSLTVFHEFTLTYNK